MKSKVRSLSGESSIPPAGAHRYRRLSGVALLSVMLLGGCWPLQGQEPAAPRIAPDTPGMVPAEDTRVDLQVPTTTPLPPAAGAANYIVTAEDLLEVLVFDVPELSHEYRVGEGGTIRMPLLASPIPAAGLTLEQLSTKISERLRSAGLVSNPQITVMVKESRAHAISVMGAVRTPQAVRALGRTTFLDVVSQAGGFTDDVGDTAIISRGEATRRALEDASAKETPETTASVPQTVTVDLRELLATGDPSLNPDVYPGDRVTVKRAGVIYVVGAVMRPGGFTLKTEHEQMTILKALALAENVKPTASVDKAMILRRNSESANGRDEIPVNLKLIMANRAPDLLLRPFDVLFVPDSAAKKALRRTADIMVGFGTAVGTGLIVYPR